MSRTRIDQSCDGDRMRPRGRSAVESAAKQTAADEAFLRRLAGLCGIGVIAGMSFALPGTAHAQSNTFIDEMQNLFTSACNTTGSGSPDCAGAGPASAGQVEVQNEGLSQRIIEQRLRELQCPPDADATANPVCGGKQGGASADTTSYEGLSLFVSGDYENKDKDNTAFETGFDSNKAGLTVGMDGRLGTDGVIGGAVSYGHTWGDFDNNGGDFNLDSIGALLYGSFYPSDQSFIDATVGVAGKDYTINRGFSRIGGGAGAPPITPAKGDTTGIEFNSSLSGGYDFSFDALTIGPRAGLNYKRTEYGSFTEHGSVLSLHYEDQVEDSLTATIGGQASYAISTDFGVVVPQVSAEYVHEFLNDQQTIHAVSAADGTPVNYLTDEPDRNYANVGAGVVFVLPNGVSPFLNYQAEVANSLETVQTVTLGVRLEL